MKKKIHALVLRLSAIDFPRMQSAQPQHVAAIRVVPHAGALCGGGA
jgi:hypothetical protein